MNSGPFSLLKIDPSKVGFFPQVKNLINYPFNAPNSVWNAVESNSMDTLIVPESMELYHQAKFTDLLSTGWLSSPIILISEALLEILLTFRLPKFYAYPTTVRKGKTQKKYYFFCIPDTHADYIDFSTCHAIVGTRKEDWREGPDDFAPIQFLDFDDFLNKKSKLNLNQYINIRKYQLVESRIQFDIFHMPYEVLKKKVSYIVSEHLASKIQSAGLTGLAFDPFPHPDHSLEVL